jgi:hypothetical protein
VVYAVEGEVAVAIIGELGDLIGAVVDRLEGNAGAVSGYRLADVAKGIVGDGLIPHIRKLRECVGHPAPNISGQAIPVCDGRYRRR